MKNYSVLAGFFSLLLVGCRIQGDWSQPPKVDPVATEVANLLTTTPITLSSSTTLTPSPAMQNGTWTAVPHDTLTPTITPTLIPFSPTPTGTLSPDDPKSGLGLPIWQESFDKDKKGFYQFEDEHTRIRTENSALVLTSFSPVGWYGWSLAFPKVRNFYLESVITTGECHGQDRYGMVFRAPDLEKGYFYGFSCDGQYNLKVYGQSDNIVEWTSNPAILAGGEKTNRMGLWVKDNHFKLFVNGEMLQEASDTTFTKEGLFGFFISAENTANFSIKVDEVAYWNIK